MSFREAVNRRTFLVRVGSLAAAPALSPLLTGCVSGLREARGTASGLSAEWWQTLEAVQAHLLPSEPDAPGSVEIDAAGYLRFVLSEATLEPAEREFLVQGIAKLEQLTRAKTGRRFSELSEDEREAVLRDFEATAEGRRWLVEMLGYLLEALLGDPVYGGNPEGVGWRWLGHRPGFPRPPARKRYFLL